VGANDAEFLEQEFTPEFEQNDLIRLANRNVYLKLMIDGITSRPFSATTITIPPLVKDEKKREEIIRLSRSKYAHKRVAVEDEINRWASNLDVPVRGGPDTADFSKPLYQPSGSKSSNQRQKLYNVKCSNCGKDTKVIFEPTPGKPVYCKSCFKKMPAQGRPAPRQKAPEKEAFVAPEQPVVENSMEQESAESLAGLGIEFTPSKIEKVAFTPSRMNKENNSTQEKSAPANKQSKRKEINLSDLRKVLEESLEKGQPQEEPQSLADEFKKRMEEEQNEDRAEEESKQP